ncbi:MAG: DUF1016 family protein [Paludibacteraceae bacterium]|nr:DUF1016 family protein [Paludibacteraceae bacterium]MBR0065175.1 DUF1016 family protein [Paludibacteraceae bacterium]
MSKNIDTYNQANDFAQVLQIIEQNRSQAVQAVNHASVLTAWQVGAYVSDKIKNAAWGSKVVQQLAEYIHTQNPSLKGWSKVTIYRMVNFYETYTSTAFHALIERLKLSQQFMSSLSAQIESEEIVSPQMTQLDEKPIMSFEMTQMPSLLMRIGWTNHQIILRGCTTPEQYVFYILYAEYEKLQNKELERAIKTDAYSRVLSDKKYQSQMLKATYPQAEVLLKDHAVLDMLGVPRKYKESKLRKGIVEHMKDFILEMGKDFLYIDQEHQLEVGGQIFRCDLLFYHRALQCLVAIELKTTKFDPRDLGQLEFYLEALDQTERRSNENPSIGILMCKDANPEVVRYALNRSMSPTMVSKYEEQLKVGSVLQRSLEEFVGFIAN